MTDILMPRLTDQMEQGTIVKWLVEDGATVTAGEELVEIETDKATMAHSVEADGTLRIVVPEGETVPVETLIAQVGAGTASPTKVPEATAAQDDAPAPAASRAAVPVGAAPAGSRNGEDGIGAATPVARRLAVVHGVALDGLRGSGPRGRITKLDVLDAAGISPADRSTTSVAARPWAPPTAAARPAPTSFGPDGRAETQELTRLQRLIARRMVEAKTTVPHFQVQTDVTMDRAIALRGQLKPLTRKDDPVPSLNDLIVRACALALRRHPLANGSYVDDTFRLSDRVNVGIAVAAPDALVVPTIVDADARSLGEIARESRRLAARVRDGQVSPAELSGGTFTVSNLGMYGMTAITPVINPPQAAILGVGAIRPVLVRVDGEIVDRALMTLTLSCDHRILYGAGAALFLSEIRELLEAPLRLAL